MACFSCIEGLAIGQPAAAWGPGFSPSQVVKFPQDRINDVKNAGQHYLNYNRTKSLYQNADGTDWLGSMKSAAVTGMNGISQLNGVASAPERSRTWLRALMR